MFILGFIFTSISQWWKSDTVGNSSESKTDIDRIC
jgi:hypothetical protein